MATATGIRLPDFPAASGFTDPDLIFMTQDGATVKGTVAQLRTALAANAIIETFAAGPSFTASISGTTMTVTAFAAGAPLAVGQTIFGTGVAGAPTILSLGTGTGGPGTYVISASQTVATEAMAAASPTQFAPGFSSSITLNGTYGSAANAEVFFDDSRQWDCTLNDQILGFNPTVPFGVQAVRVSSRTSLQIGVPSDGSVGDDQLAWGNVLNRVVDSVGALQSLDPSIYKRAFVTGYYAAGDGGGGSYYYSASTVQGLANGGSVIAASGGIGCWKLEIYGSVSIRQFGAKGDGVTDDSAAVQAALNAWPSVLQPTGTFRYKNVTVPAHTKFYGTQSISSGLPSNVIRGCWTYCTDTVNPIITLESGASVEGIAFWYPNQVSDGTPIAYPATIMFDHDVYNASVKECFFANSYVAINNSPLSGNASFNIKDCCGYALYRGISLSNGLDISRITRCTFTQNMYPGKTPGPALAAWVQANATAFEIFRQDGGRATDCFAFGYQIGFANINSTGGWEWIGCSADGTKFPFAVTGTSDAITLNACSMAAISFVDGTDAACDALTINCSGSVIVNGCRFGYSTRDAMTVLAASCVVATGNSFENVGALATSAGVAAAIRVGTAVSNVNATGNVIDCNNQGFSTGLLLNNGGGATVFNSNTVKNTGAQAAVTILGGSNNFSIQTNVFKSVGGAGGISDASGSVNKLVANNLPI